MRQHAAVFCAFVFVTMQRCAAELPAPNALVSEAAKACDALDAARLAAKERTGRENPRDRAVAQQAWTRLALAHVNLGQYDEAVAALNHINSDPRYSQISVQAMRTEVEGVIAPWPEKLPAPLKQLQRSVLVNILIDRRQFDLALKECDEITDESMRAVRKANALLARARTVEKSDRTAMLKDVEEASSCLKEIDDARAAGRIVLDISRIFVRNDPPALARVMVEPMEKSLANAPLSAAQWLEFGALFTQIGAAEPAARCLERAKKQQQAGDDATLWDQTYESQLWCRFRHEAHESAEDTREMKDVLDEWESSFRDLKNPKTVGLAAPALICAEIRAERTEEAARILEQFAGNDAIAVAGQTSVLVNEKATAEQKSWLAGQLKSRHSDDENFHAAMLFHAAECYRSAGDVQQAAAAVEAARGISERRGQTFHENVARWFAQADRPERSYAVVQETRDPARRAMPLAELAYQATKRRTP